MQRPVGGVDTRLKVVNKSKQEYRPSAKSHHRCGGLFLSIIPFIGVLAFVNFIQDSLPSPLVLTDRFIYQAGDVAAIIALSPRYALIATHAVHDRLGLQFDCLPVSKV